MALLAPFTSFDEFLPTESTASGEGYPEDSGEDSCVDGTDSCDEGTGKDLICSWMCMRAHVCV